MAIDGLIEKAVNAVTGTTGADSFNYNSTAHGDKSGAQYIRFNPPITRMTSGAYVSTRMADNTFDMESGFNDRSRLLGEDSHSYRHANKGVLYQDWDTRNTTSDGTADTATNTWGVANPQYENFKTTDDYRYGFRFHYNPSTIDFSINADNLMVDPSLILSGMSRAMPITSRSLPVVNFSLIINRIEEVSLLKKWNYQEYDDGFYRAMNYYFGRNLTPEEIEGLVTRGTGYDMEFLFRTLLGRPYKTELRGETADIGIVFGLPLILDFSPKNLSEIHTAIPSGSGINKAFDNSGAPTTSRFSATPAQHSQRYWGRVVSLSYTHREFTREMIPMFTEVSISFARFPDAQGVLKGLTVQQALQPDSDGTPLSGTATISGTATTGQQAAGQRLAAQAAAALATATEEIE